MTDEERLAEYERFMGQASRYIKTLEAALQWIPVSEHLPDEGWYLVYADGAMNCMMFDGAKWYDPTYASVHNIRIADITHWMILPPAPEKEL